MTTGNIIITFATFKIHKKVQEKNLLALASNLTDNAVNTKYSFGGEKQHGNVFNFK